MLYADSTNRMLTVAFKCPSEIYNVLVLLTDAKGNTIFLENKQRFKGEYQRTVDLKGSAPGIFELQVINDEERITQSLSIH
jgi:hypothetical protein